MISNKSDHDIIKISTYVADKYNMLTNIFFTISFFFFCYCLAEQKQKTNQWDQTQSLKDINTKPLPSMLCLDWSDGTRKCVCVCVFVRGLHNSDMLFKSIQSVQVSMGHAKQVQHTSIHADNHAHI